MSEQTLARDARPGCRICMELGWHWGWDADREPVKIRCPCVDLVRATRKGAASEINLIAGWQPIATLPTSGDYFEVCDVRSGARSIVRPIGPGLSQIECIYGTAIEPTHWKPLTPLPDA